MSDVSTWAVAEAFEYELCNLSRQKRRYGIPNLDVLLGPVAQEQIVVWEGLQPRSLANCQAAALPRIGMDEVMPVLRYVAGHGRRCLVGYPKRAVSRNASGSTRRMGRELPPPTVK